MWLDIRADIVAEYLLYISQVLISIVFESTSYTCTYVHSSMCVFKIFFFFNLVVSVAQCLVQLCTYIGTGFSPFFFFFFFFFLNQNNVRGKENPQE